METPELKSRFENLQKYIPFLERLIEKLQNDKKNEENPETSHFNHLKKVKMLYDLLTNDSKKLKLDALCKCEKVLEKLCFKIEQMSSLQDGVSETIIVDEIDKDKSKIVNNDSANKTVGPIVSVPESPPPEEHDDDCVFVPLVIPTERCITPDVKKHHHKHHKHSHRREKSHHRDRSEKTDDRKYKYDTNSYNNRDKFERNMHDHGRYNNDRNERDRYDKNLIKCGTEGHHQRYPSYERKHSNDRENLFEKSKPNDDPPKGVFSRLGHKLTDDKSNVLAKAAEGLKRTITQNVSGSSSIDVKPFSKRLNDSMSPVGWNKGVETAYGIGERRTPKPENREMSKLEEVRKKLSLLAKCSKELTPKDSSNSQKGQEQNYQSDKIVVQDPRLKKNSYATSTQPSNTITLGNNILPVNRPDPRLRKNSNSCSSSSKSYPQFSETANKRDNTSKDCLPKTHWTKKQVNNSEENWDTENTSASLPSSWSKNQSQELHKRNEPSPIENWDGDVFHNDNNYKSFENSTHVNLKNYIEKSLDSSYCPLSAQEKTYEDRSHDDFISFSRRNNFEKTWDDQRKLSHISSSSKLENKSVFDALKDNQYTHKKDVFDKELDEDALHKTRLDSIDSNRRRVEKEEIQSRVQKMSDKSNCYNEQSDTNSLEDDIPASSKFNLVFCKSSEAAEVFLLRLPRNS